MGADCSQYTHWACVHWPLRLLETSKQNIPEINLAHVEMVLGMKGTSVSQVTAVCEALHWGLESVCLCVLEVGNRREQKACEISTPGSHEPEHYPRSHQRHIVTAQIRFCCSLTEPGKSSNCSVLQFPCL